MLPPTSGVYQAGPGVTVIAGPPPVVPPSVLVYAPQERVSPRSGGLVPPGGLAPTGTGYGYGSLPGTDASHPIMAMKPIEPTAGPQREYKDLGWVQQTGTWKLLFQQASAVGANVLALFMLWYNFYHHQNQGYLMRCDVRQENVSLQLGYACSWTKAFLRTFPLMAVNISMVVAMRVFFQHRMYYSILKAEGLLDFVPARLLANPLYWVLVVYLGMGACHFVIKYLWEYYTGADPMVLASTAENTLHDFVLPSVAFLVFFYHSTDIEKALVTLNRYLEEDFANARRTVATMPMLVEETVYYEVNAIDLVAEVGGPATLDGRGRASLRDVCRRLVTKYGEADKRHRLALASGTSYTWGWFRGFWPARILLDSRLNWNSDPSQRQSVMALEVAMLCCGLIALVSFVAFGYEIYIELWKYNHMDFEDQHLITILVIALNVGTVAVVIGKVLGEIMG